MIPLWKGSCNQWDCDEMGHMNVRVYVEKQLEGMVAFAHHLGMPEAFRTNAPATVLPIDQHIRFVREVLPGKPLSMRGCVLEIGESDAVIYQELRHLDGSLSAAFRTRIIHLDTAEGERFPWTRRTRARMEATKGTTPEEAPQLRSGFSRLAGVRDYDFQGRNYWRAAGRHRRRAARPLRGARMDGAVLVHRPLVGCRAESAL